MQPTVVFDLDKVLLGGDASTLFLHGRLRQAPVRAIPLLLASPLLVPGSAVPQTRPLAARVMTRLAVGGRSESDVDAVAAAYGDALARKPDGGELDVVGSTGVLWPPRVRRAMGESKVAMLTERGYPPPWRVAYSDSGSDLPLFAGAQRPVLVNSDEKTARRIERTLGRPPETVTWR